MAKKPKKDDMTFNIEFRCLIKVNSEHKEKFEADLKRGELCCSAEFSIDEVCFSFNLYSDSVSGGINFKQIDESTYEVSGNGRHVMTDDFDKLPIVRKLDPKPLLMISHVSDSDSNWHYINGDEDAKLPIGTFVL